MIVIVLVVCREVLVMKFLLLCEEFNIVMIVLVLDVCLEDLEMVGFIIL